MADLLLESGSGIELESGTGVIELEGGVTPPPSGAVITPDPAQGQWVLNATVPDPTEAQWALATTVPDPNQAGWSYFSG